MSVTGHTWFTVIQAMRTEVDGNPALQVFAIERETVIGHCKVDLHEPAILVDLWVAPERRGWGCGRELVQKAIEETPGSLTVYYMPDSHGERIFTRMGFVPTGGRGGEGLDSEYIWARREK